MRHADRRACFSETKDSALKTRLQHFSRRLARLGGAKDSALKTRRQTPPAATELVSVERRILHSGGKTSISPAATELVSVERRILH